MRAAESPIRAVLFDFDGVIVNSMPGHARAWVRIFAEKGLDITEEDVYLHEGRPTVDVAHVFLSRHGLPAEKQHCRALAAHKQAYYLSKPGGVVIFPEIVPIIESVVGRGIAAAVVTGSNDEVVRRTLPKKLRSFFSAFVTADDIKKGKPDPEPWLKAAEKLAVQPKACLVVENAPLGIQAARAAGMRALAITTTLQPEHLQGAEAVARNFDELARLIESRLNGEH
ncbi:MAG TPA: HAD family phosphatase [Bacteroidetes bacterium]|nr:HAD family phosphatase [Bacteroidota bacterium]